MIDLNYLLQPGIANRECVSFKVLSPDSLGRYVVFLTQETTPGFVSTKILSTFWFPDQAVNTGDTVYLYTKPGTNGSVLNTDGTKTYLYFWGHQSTVLNNPTAAIVLMHASEWKYKKAG